MTATAVPAFWGSMTVMALFTIGVSLLTADSGVSSDSISCTNKELKDAQHTIWIRREAGKPVAGKPEYERPGADICQVERAKGPTGDTWKTGKDFGYTVDEVLPEGLKANPNIQGTVSAAHRIYLRISANGTDVYVKRGIAITGQAKSESLFDDTVLAVINTQGNFITIMPEPSYQLADLVSNYHRLMVGPTR